MISSYMRQHVLMYFTRSCLNKVQIASYGTECAHTWGSTGVYDKSCRNNIKLRRKQRPTTFSDGRGGKQWLSASWSLYHALWCICRLQDGALDDSLFAASIKNKKKKWEFPQLIAVHSRLRFEAVLLISITQVQHVGHTWPLNCLFTVKRLDRNVGMPLKRSSYSVWWVFWLPPTTSTSHGIEQCEQKSMNCS